METKRFLVFLLGCIGTRLSLSMLAKYITIDYLPFLTIITIPIAISFMYLYIFGNDRADRQLEWLGDKKIWWDDLRPVHSILFMLFSIMAINKSSYSWIVLLLDTVVGLVAWLNHHKLIFS
jgi:hypothetical protein